MFFQSLSEFRQLLSLATESSFIFNESWFKQIDGVAMGSPLAPTLANAFLCFMEKGGQNNALMIKNQFITEYMYMKFLYYLNLKIIFTKFCDYINKFYHSMNSLLGKKGMENCLIWLCKCPVKEKKLLILYVINLLLLVLMYLTFWQFYHSHINLE